MSRFLGLVTALVVIAQPLVGAQAPPASQAPDHPSQPLAPTSVASPSFTSGVDVVTLTVTVTDQSDHYIRDLTRHDFTLSEDGVQQPVSFFGRSDVPLDLSIVIDTSASMYQNMAILKQGAIGLVRTLGRDDRVSVIEFRDVMRVLQPMTAQHGRAAAAIASLRPSGSTSLYNALYVTLRGMATVEAPAEVRRRALVVFSDGLDTSSLVTFEDVMEAARRAAVSVYVVSLHGPDHGERVQGFASEQDYNLRSLAEQTGACAFFPVTAMDIQQVYKTLAAELASQYALGYVPLNGSRDGGWRRVSVRVADRPGAHARARTGYYASRGAWLSSLLQH